MYNDNKFVFYEKQYYHELEMKQKIDLKLQALIVFAFAWLNLTSYMVQVVDDSGDPLVSYSYYFFVAIYLFLLGMSLRYSVFSFYGNVYQYIETPKVFDDYYQEMHTYYAKYHDGDNPAELELNKFIKENLINSTHHNALLNDARSQKSFESTKWMVISFVPFVIAFIIFVYFKLDLTHPTKPILIEEKNLTGAYNYVERLNATNTETIPAPKTVRY
ncbi:hypothetical protein F0251_24510 [Vibrio sp. 070316B]|uniref:hypothetical protein n=1 Tax=Vibrio sp. 070316B TaxID=2607608 RepID=UPI0014936AFA|nr:hypothetical protein [Vibrio sp. 070316B]NOI41554.1 hypothetical protein [Vibrio sp. 070316B]CAH6937876.1 membrane hypothetical protein [Vibrio chagasii]